MVLVSLFHCENVKQESEEEEEEQGEDEQEGDDVIVEDDEAAKEDEEGDKKRDNEWGAEEENIDMRERGDGQVSVTIICIDLSVRKVYFTETACAFLVANATTNFALAARISPLVASGRLTMLFHTTIITQTIALILSQND